MEAVVTPRFWADRPVLVTGASGLVGAWVVDRLLISVPMSSVSCEIRCRRACSPGAATSRG